MTQATQPNFKALLESFLQSEDFPRGVIASTRASWKGDSYSVELLPGGSWRVLWTEYIGNKYESEGIILHIPTLSNEDYNELVEIAGSDADDALVGELRGSDTFAEIAEELHVALADKAVQGVIGE